MQRVDSVKVKGLESIVGKIKRLTELGLSRCKSWSLDGIKIEIN